ncbi:MAG TPA: nicotinate phosphoribosyltransferase [Nitrososphaeraceae archaeon]
MLFSESDYIGDFALSIDFYELTMAAAYYYSSHNEKSVKKRGVFEMFIRKLPTNRSYLVAAGLEQALYFLTTIKFNNKQISYLKSLEAFKCVDEDFFEYLKKFRFTGTVWAVPEGTILFPNEPIIRIEAPMIEAQIVETYILSVINFQTLIATKASRIVNAANRKPVIEFGSRRAHGPQAGILAARSAYIGGCVGTSNTLAGYKLGIPVFGTMAHSFVMSFNREEDAFIQFSRIFPTGYLLVDTYDSIVAVKKIINSGIDIHGIRLDSGNLFQLSKESRRLLDNAGHIQTKIMATGDLNENVISNLVDMHAPIDSFGVGTDLSTSRDDPVMGGVYKLVAVKLSHTSEIGKDSVHNKIIYTMKTSSGKKTYPGPKQIFRIIKNDGIKKDILVLEDDDDGKSLKGGVSLLVKMVDKGKLVCKLPSLVEIQKYHIEQLNLLHKSYKTLEFMPFPVVFSKRLKAITRQFKPN